MKRFGQLIGLHADQYEKYREYHADVWPEVLQCITRCNIRNYSIFHHNGQLFAYFEYTGTDFKADMDKMAADPKTLEWWNIMMPMQKPLDTKGEGDWWTDMEEVFHHD